MAVSRDEILRFNRFPMGPKLQAYLSLGEDYLGQDAPVRDPAAETALTALLKDHHNHNSDRLSDQEVVDLIDELVTMDLAEAALDLARQRPDAAAPTDFRAQLALGVAAMLTGDLAASEAALRQAQAVLPEEPAPYVNLVQIFIQQDRRDEAEVWCLAGLDAEPNNLRLWDLLASLYAERFGDYLGDELMRVAEKRASWAGVSLAAEMTTTGDRYLKATKLDRLYAQGERDPQFLIELTGAYGIADQLDRIPALVWQAERASVKPLPWQLHLHCAQAQIGLGQGEAALESLAKAERDASMPAEVRSALDDLKRDAADAASPVRH